MATLLCFEHILFQCNYQSHVFLCSIMSKCKDRLLRVISNLQKSVSFSPHIPFENTYEISLRCFAYTVSKPYLQVRILESW